jgi:hypothetical protein
MEEAETVVIKTILNESTTFSNQIMCVLFIIYTALHVSAYKQAIIRCYLTNYKRQKKKAVIKICSHQKQAINW